jgi:hypothetical protein
MLAFLIIAGGAADKPANDVGMIHFHGPWVRYSPTGIDLHNGFTITSTQYDASGEKAHVTLDKEGTYTKIEVWGDPTTNTQLSATFKDVTNGESAPASPNAAQSGVTTMQFFADHAVLVPDDTRPDGQKATFTGNVHMKVYSADLAGPSVATMDSAVVLLGDKPDYPQVEADNVDGTAEPKSE